MQYIARILFWGLWLLTTTWFWFMSVLVVLAIFCLCPVPTIWRAHFSSTVARLTELWMGAQTWLMNHLLPTVWDIDCPFTFHRNGRYFLLCNHQSWTDTFVLMRILHGKMPLLRYFAKRTLLWLPIFNIGFYVLHFPMMRRFDKAALLKNPDLRLKDIKSIQATCTALQSSPFGLVHFTEGTRNTSKKHQAQHSPYQHLLAPKSGGLAAFLQYFPTETLDGFFDFTIVYPQGNFRFIDFLGGKLPIVKVQVRALHLPPALRQGDYDQDPIFRESFKAWLTDLWKEKDQYITLLLATSGANKCNQRSSCTR